jgi:hypothetical protein
MSHNVPLERDFQAYVLRKLREIPNSWWVKLNDRTTIGLPDIVGCVAGVFFAFELKTKTKVTALQAHTLKKIERAGGQAEVVTPENFDEVYDFVRKTARLGREDLK